MDSMDPALASPPARRRRPEHVLVSYEASADGQAALSHALRIADTLEARLSVVAVAPHEPTNVGCTRCRWNAVMWNRELDAIAKEELAEAASLVGSEPMVRYEVAHGTNQTSAIKQAASRCGADLIVLPRRRHDRVRRKFGRDLAERLRRDGRWHVVVAPFATAQRSVHKAPDVGPSGFRAPTW